MITSIGALPLEALPALARRLTAGILRCKQAGSPARGS